MDHEYVPLKADKEVEVMLKGIDSAQQLNIEKYIAVDKEAREKEEERIREIKKKIETLEAERSALEAEKHAKEKELAQAKGGTEEKLKERERLEAELATADRELSSVMEALDTQKRQNEESMRALEAIKKRICRCEEELRGVAARNEEKAAELDRARKKNAEVRSRVADETKRLEAEVTEHRKKLEDTQRKEAELSVGDDDDDDNEDIYYYSGNRRGLDYTRSPSGMFTRGLQIHVDFTPSLSSMQMLQQQQQQQEGTSVKGGSFVAALNACQNLRDAMPGPTKTGKMRDIEAFDVRERLGVWGSGKPVFRAILRENGEVYALKKVVFRSAPAPVLKAVTWTSAKPTDEEKCQYSISKLSSSELACFTEPYLLTSILEGNKDITQLVRPEFYVRDMQSKGTLFYIATPYYSSMDLEYGLARGIVGRAQLRSIAEQLFTAVSYLHSLGIVHRDICTASVLVRKPASQLSPTICPIALAGMGRATLAERAGGPSSVPHTRFHPPECFHPPQDGNDNGNEGYDFWTAADIWGVGCVLAEVALGGKMFSTRELADITDDVVRERGDAAAERAGEKDQGVVSCIRNTVVMNPRGRFTAIRALNELGIRPNVFNCEQPVVVEDDNIRTFISQRCPFATI